MSGSEHVTEAYNARRSSLGHELTNSKSEEVQRALVKAILVTDVCAQTYADLKEVLSTVIDAVTERMRATTSEISQEGSRLERAAAAASQYGPEAFVMQKAMGGLQALQYDTLAKAIEYDGDFLKFINQIADETTKAVLTPPEPRMVKAVLAVAWDKLVEAPVDDASLFVTAVIRKMREQLPKASDADSYLLQLREYTQSVEKALYLMEALRQLLLTAGSRTTGGDSLDVATLQARATTAVRDRSETIARQFQTKE
jgi:hypothetical protein